MTETKSVWTEEDELEFQMGDMNGIAFEEETIEEHVEGEVLEEKLRELKNENDKNN